MKKRRYKEALEFLELALQREEFDSGKMVIYNDIGRCYLHIDVQKAFEYFVEGFLLDKNEKSFHTNIVLCADAMLREDKTKEAFDIFNKALQLDPENSAFKEAYTRAKTNHPNIS